MSWQRVAAAAAARRLALAPSLARGGPSSLSPPLALLPPQIWRRCASSSSGGETVKVNILREGSDPPVLDDAEYPDWLWDALDSPSLAELKAKQSEGGEMTPEESRRFWQKTRTAVSTTLRANPPGPGSRSGPRTGPRPRPRPRSRDAPPTTQGIKETNQNQDF